MNKPYLIPKTVIKYVSDLPARARNVTVATDQLHYDLLPCRIAIKEP